MEYYRFDLHTHSYYSWDGHDTISAMVRQARHNSVNVLAITDHDDNRSHKELKHYSLKKHGVLVIPGVEFSAKEGHIVGLGFLEPLEKGVPGVEVVEHIHDQGGLAILAHPFDFLRSGAGAKAQEFNIDIIEAFNASTLFPWPNYRAKRYAKKLGYPMVGDSDAHRVNEIGMAFSLSLTLPESMDQLFDLLLKNETIPSGKRIGVFRKTTRFLKRKLRRKHPLEKETNPT